jgi:hypothetical protein
VGEERFDTLFSDEGSTRKGKGGSTGFDGVIKTRVALQRAAHHSYRVSIVGSGQLIAPIIIALQ